MENFSGVKYYLIFLCSALMIFLNPYIAVQAGENHSSVWIELKKENGSYIDIENINYHPLKKTKVALVLSGGGARGFAHIGVLKAFEESQVPLDMVVGSSIGSIIGGLYCAGYTAEQIHHITQEIDWKNLYSDPTYRSHLFLSQKDIPRRHLLQLRLDGIIPYIPRSITYGQKVYQLIYDYIIKADYQALNDFDELKIPFRSVATDLISGKRVVLKRGDLAEAINASIAFPLLFAPVEIGNMWLVDGGITDNLPVDVARDLGADVVVAVDATSPLRQEQEMEAPWEIADQVTTIMMEEKTRKSLLNADLAIKLDLHKHRAGDFSDIDSIIQTGYEHTLNLLDSLQNIIKNKTRTETEIDTLSGKVSAVKFEGVDEDSLLNYAFRPKVRAGKMVSKEDILSDLKLFYESGYFEEAKARVEFNTSGMVIYYYLKQQPIVENLVINRHHILPDSLIIAIEKDFSHQVFNPLKLKTSLDDLKKKLYRMGYGLAHIQNIKFSPNSGKLFVNLDEGIIKSIKVDGNLKTHEFVILREFLLKEGDYFKAEQSLRGIQNIYSTGLFYRVSVNSNIDSTGSEIIIRVKEKKTLVMRIGGHASLERSVDGFLEFSEDNLLGSGIKLNLFGAIGEFEKHANVSLSTTRLLNTYFTFRLSMNYDEERYRYFINFKQFDNYQTINRGAKFIFGHQFGRLGQISAELRLEDIEVTSRDLYFPYEGKYRIRSFTIRSVVDKRDRLPFPESGIYNRWFWESGNRSILGGSVSFTRVYIGLEGYYSFLKYFNFHPFAFGGSGDLTVPFSEFYFFGGQQSFPGLYEHEALGRQMLQGGADLRWKFSWNLPIEAFLIGRYTIGAAWTRSDAKIETSDFLHSFSVSAAVNTLFGPVQLTYGSIVNGRSLFYFSIGYDF